MLRTHNCGELRIKDRDIEVVLAGWLAKQRDFGSLTFIDLRDRYGKTQIIINTEHPELAKIKSQLKLECVLQVKGKVVERKDKNKDRVGRSLFYS